MAGYIEPKAAWKVTLGGEDLTAKLEPRLISLRLSERRGEQADELQIVLHDADGAVAIPAEGAMLKLQLGWERGTGVTVGLVDKGTFTVDDIEWGGPPDQLSIRARSADLKETFRTRTNKVWSDTTVGAIVSAIAAGHSLKARCHPDLAAEQVKAAEQSNKSDMQFVRDLGRRYDATATVKGGALIFAPIGAPTTSSGKPLPTTRIERSRCSRVTWKRAARENGQDGAEAQWHDKDAAERKTTSTGGKNRKRLKKVYASEGDAKAASKAEAARLKRAAASLDLDLSLGDPGIAPGVKVTTSGFKKIIDDQKWLVASTNHEMSKAGLSTKIILEADA